jgi:F0F1-type ATP synthase epsilon subunit
MTQHNHLPNQVGISGGNINISDSTISIAGRDISFGTVQDKQELLSQLEKLKEAFVKAGETQIISEDKAIDAEAEVKKAIGQAKKSTPDKKSILGYLTTAKSLIEGIGEASGLITSIVGAIEAVHKLFP